MTLFGNTTLPHVLKIKRTQPRIKQEVALPGSQFAYRRDLGGLGATFQLDGEIRPSSQQLKDLLASLADGTARILDLEESTLTVLESCFRWYTGLNWVDNTLESQSTVGAPFSLLAASTDYAYFGHRDRFNQLTFTCAAFASYGTLLWQYSDGAGGWKTLTVTDGTSKFVQNGNVTFTPPADWKRDTVNAVLNKFWVRVSAASVTTPATINQIQLNTVFNCIMQDPIFSEDVVAHSNLMAYTLLFVQQENP